MNTRKDPKEIAEAMISRSVCSVQVGAVLVDVAGNVFSWAWNTVGPDGLGLHAEIHCIKRANKHRLEGSTILVASQRRRNHKTICSKPCVACQYLLDKYDIHCLFRDADSVWKGV